MSDTLLLETSLDLHFGDGVGLRFRLTGDREDVKGDDRVVRQEGMKRQGGELGGLEGDGNARVGGVVARRLAGGEVFQP